MEESETARRLATLERLLHLVVAALAPEPEETGASTFDYLVEVLSDLTVAVADLNHSVRRLPCSGCVRSPRDEASSCVDG